MVIAALGILFVRKAVHAALLLAVVMISLAILYAVPRRAVPLRGADHRLHRRDPDAVPLRADAGRCRRLRLGRRDDPWPAGARHHRRAAARPGARHRPQPDLARHGGRPRRGQRGRQHRGARRHPVLALRLRLRDHQRAAHHRCRRRDGAGPPRAADAEVVAGRPGRPAGPRLRRARPAPRPAAGARRLRPAQRGRHPGPAARRHRRRVLGVAGPRRARHGAVGAGDGRRRTCGGAAAQRSTGTRARTRPPPRRDEEETA